jgi:hypothetical protein
MRAKVDDNLLARADATLKEAEQLRLKLDQNIALAHAICRQGRMNAVLQEGLPPVLAISVVERS